LASSRPVGASLFPANREFYREYFHFLLQFTTAANKSPAISNRRGQIPCSTKTGKREVYFCLMLQICNCIALAMKLRFNAPWSFGP
jgi:hypothetical protein